MTRALSIHASLLGKSAAGSSDTSRCTETRIQMSFKSMPGLCDVAALNQPASPVALSVAMTRPRIERRLRKNSPVANDKNTTVAACWGPRTHL